MYVSDMYYQRVYHGLNKNTRKKTVKNKLIIRILNTKYSNKTKFYLSNAKNQKAT